MRIVLASPLYPPEIAEPAPYVKELARRLSAEHEVTIVAYTHLPEHVPNVAITAVEKGRPLPLRLIRYARSLMRAARRADVIYAVNGTSVELPLLLTAAVTRVPILFCIADPAAHLHAEESLLRRYIERSVRARAFDTVLDVPSSRPEILPLEPYPTEALASYEATWALHLGRLAELFSHAV